MKNLLTIQLGSLQFLDDRHRAALDKAGEALNAEVIVIGTHETATLTANPTEVLNRVDDLCNLVGQLVVQNARLLEALVMSEGEEGSVGFGSMSNKG